MRDVIYLGRGAGEPPALALFGATLEPLAYHSWIILGDCPAGETLYELTPGARARQVLVGSARAPLAVEEQVTTWEIAPGGLSVRTPALTRSVVRTGELGLETLEGLSK
jgi:hypothetical protein